jgi:hypothetical protein
MTTLLAVDIRLRVSPGGNPDVLDSTNRDANAHGIR